MLGSRREIVALVVPAVLYVIFLLAADSWVNLRYLIPTLVIGTVVACYGVAEVGRRLFSTSMFRQVWCGIVVGTCLLPAGFAMYFKLVQTHPHQHWLGIRSETEYLVENDNPDIYMHATVRRWINGQLPDEARIVMPFEGRGFGFQPEVVQTTCSGAGRFSRPASPGAIVCGRRALPTCS